MTHLLNISSSAVPWLVVLPLILPLVALGFAMLAWQRPRWQQAIGLVTGTGLLGTAVLLLLNVGNGTILSTRVGNWPAPVGILLEADILTALMLTLSAVMTMTTLIYSAGTWEGRPGSRFFIPLVMVTVLGVNGAFLTRDLFNLYVWFEVLLMGSFGVLVVTGGQLGREAALKSLTLNLIGSLVFLLAVGTVYGLAGTLDMYDLQQRLAQVHAERPHAVTGVAALLMMAFAVKAALFPFHFWLPASYHVPTAGICALFAALLTKVGIYSLLRILTLPFSAVQGLETILGVLAGLTMLVGVLGAVSPVRDEADSGLAQHQPGGVHGRRAGSDRVAFRGDASGWTGGHRFLHHPPRPGQTGAVPAGRIGRQVPGHDRSEKDGRAASDQASAGPGVPSGRAVPGGYSTPVRLLGQAGRRSGRPERGPGLAGRRGSGCRPHYPLSMVKIWNEVFWKPRPDAQGCPGGVSGKPSRRLGGHLGPGGTGHPDRSLPTALAGIVPSGRDFPPRRQGSLRGPGRSRTMTMLRNTWHVLGKIPMALGFLGFFLVELVRSTLRVAHDVVTPQDFRSARHHLHTPGCHQ